MQPSIREPRHPAAGAADAGPFALDTILDDSSWSARRLSKRKVRLMTRIEAKVRSILEPGERVRYVTFGTTLGFWETYWVGWVMYYLNRRAILLTDRRMILLQIDSRHRPRELVSEVRYTSIRRVKRTLLGNAKMVFGNGRKKLFAYIPRRDRAFLQRLVEWTDTALAPGTGGWQDLCPHCHVQVAGRPVSCPACGGRLKSARSAGLLSLLFPGLGDLYLGHTLFALMELAVSAVVWLAVLVSALSGPAPAAAFVAAGLVLILFLHVPDAVITAYIGRKGLYPKR